MAKQLSYQDQGTESARWNRTWNFTKMILDFM